MPQFRTADCAVTVSELTLGQVVEVRLAGELDRDAAPMLADVTGYVNALAPHLVIVELGDLDFAGAALPNWLARMQGLLHGRPPVSVRHPQPLIGRVLDLTEMAHLVADSLPTDRSPTPSRAPGLAGAGSRR